MWKIGKQHHQTSAAVTGQGGSDLACPEDRKGAQSTPSRDIPVDLNFGGTVGLQLDGEARVQVRDLRLDGQTTIDVGQPAVVPSNSGRGGCEANFSRTLAIELPVQIAHQGTLTIDLEAFAQLVAHSASINMNGQLGAGGAAPVPSPVVQN